MIVPVYITMEDGADRPYVSSTPPSKERKDALKKRGAVVYLAEVLVPGFRLHDYKVQAIAVEIDEVQDGED